MLGAAVGCTTENGNNAGSETLIGEEQAKTIALEHSGFTASDVTFSKAALDYDDGQRVYEIEFYKGRTEYEYEINAISGKIMDFDID